MKNQRNDTQKSSLWQEFEYRKRLKNLIESGLSLAEIETRSQQIYEELKSECTTEAN
ncbi:hypothetical protein [Mannheimia haemolytica]|uniref:hypothetical protein n=1 Tax=Mannheimia haemolytica TaxID=75985 RepID=UPI00186534D3|nr:hypothetical protein [Mannheimia haemolytica]